ncbi:hypothetical protein EVAR_36084_1 [Eumeta japonica]|uniref:Uncharacterized protein n=1 Tax=Eumeta variegata TaxID=151549 RepID=A0A4C1YJV1_EUMVA|nr:hypothetical protein EVAR_36084_1 [Eumeta japonica]
MVNKIGQAPPLLLYKASGKAFLIPNLMSTGNDSYKNGIKPNFLTDSNNLPLTKSYTIAKEYSLNYNSILGLASSESEPESVAESKSQTGWGAEVKVEIGSDRYREWD